MEFDANQRGELANQPNARGLYIELNGITFECMVNSHLRLQLPFNYGSLAFNYQLLSFSNPQSHNTNTE
jgi:hypothetical protein